MEDAIEAVIKNIENKRGDMNYNDYWYESYKRPESKSRHKYIVA